MDKTIPIPEQDYDNLPDSTSNFSTNRKLDTDLRRFTEEVQRDPFPSKRRTMRLYMPQEVEPKVLIDVEKLIIGRESGDHHLDLSLQYAKMLGVSREHAEITFEDGKYYITDLNSTNGTFLNNQKLEPNQPERLEHSDQLRLGHFVMILGFS